MEEEGINRFLRKLRQVAEQRPEFDSLGRRIPSRTQIENTIYGSPTFSRGRGNYPPSGKGGKERR